MAALVATNISPNAANYYIGRGVASWTPLGGTKRDLGNAPVFQLKPAIKNLDHFSSRQGTKLKDRSVAIEANMTLIMKLDEWTEDNLVLALMGDVAGGNINIMSQSEVTGQIDFQGTNLVGAKCTIVLPLCNLTPTGTIDFISADKFGELEITADVLQADPAVVSFGTLTWTP
jgi:hypothetical protein